MTAILEGWTIVFDLDGTLVESAPDLLRALNHTLGHAGLPPVELDVIRTMIGGGAKAMITRGMDFHGQSVDGHDMDRLWQTFIDHYEANIAVHSHLYDGVEAALDQIAGEGATLAVCTNKIQRLAEKVLDAFALTSRFKAIVGADSVSARKPDATHLLETLTRCGGDRSRAIMVGDSQTDEKAARNAGLPFLFVPFGYEAAPADEIDARAIVHHYSDLYESILAAKA